MQSQIEIQPIGCKIGDHNQGGNPPVDGRRRLTPRVKS